MWYRVRCFILIMAVLALGGCAAPQSPVGESRGARTVRESKGADKAARQTDPEQGVSQALSAGVNIKDKAALAASATVSGDAITDGDPEGVHLELWTYDGDHVAYYRKLLKKWNDEDPDYTIEMTFTTKPYDELHDSLLEALRSGEGAPDICDIDAYRFSEVTEGLDGWLYPLDVAVAPYLYDMHPARMDVYKASDGRRYGVPFRMGAAVQYWNMEILEAAGITKNEVDAVKTWGDYNALGEKFNAAPGRNGKYFTIVDEEDAVWPMLAVAEYSNDSGNAADATAEMKDICQGWIGTQIAKSSDDITGDIASGKVASFIGSLSYMDKFVEDMRDMSGKWYITKCPVFEEGQPCSVCLDDTVTVITAQSRAAALAADYICYAKMYSDNAKSVLWPDLSYDVCNRTLWEDDDFAHDVTNEYDTFFRNYPYDVLREINDRIATVKP